MRLHVASGVSLSAEHISEDEEARASKHLRDILQSSVFFQSGWESSCLHGPSGVPNDRASTGYFILKKRGGNGALSIYCSADRGTHEMICLVQYD